MEIKKKCGKEGWGILKLVVLFGRERQAERKEWGRGGFYILGEERRGEKERRRSFERMVCARRWFGQSCTYPLSIILLFQIFVYILVFIFLFCLLLFFKNSFKLFD